LDLQGPCPVPREKSTLKLSPYKFGAIHGENELKQNISCAVRVSDREVGNMCTITDGDDFHAYLILRPRHPR
jgi:hypothetical protein